MSKNRSTARLLKRASELSKPDETVKVLPWSVVSHKLFKVYEPAGAEDGRTRGTLCAEVGVSGWVDGQFRWNISGAEIIRVAVPAGDILEWPGAAEFNLTLEVRPEDIRLRDNSSSGDWEDLSDLIARSKIIASRGEEDDSHEFLGKRQFPYGPAT